MKRLLMILTAAASVMWLAVSCEEGTETENTVSVNIEVVAAEGAEVPAGTVFDVTVTNYDTRSEQTFKTDADGKLTVEGLVLGRYTVTASVTLYEDGLSYIYSGTLSNVNLLEDGTTLTVPVSVAKASQLVIKELYYGFSKNEAGKSYVDDQFYEIYNNSDATVYVDGLCFGHLMPERATGKANYDWGMDTQKYAFFAIVMKVPGKVGDTNYPVEPGESIVLCKSAKNHQAADANPLSPVDLSGGEFEYYHPENTKQVDEDAVNLELAYFNKSRTQTAYKQWSASRDGWAFAMFFPEENEFSAGQEASSELSGAKYYSYPVPVEQIIDAVECVTDETQVANKRVPTVLDAGSIWLTDENGEPATALGRSLVRKVSNTLEDGRVILQDTNNSTDDFECMKAEVRRYNAGIPSWNTWASR